MQKHELTMQFVRTPQSYPPGDIAAPSRACLGHFIEDLFGRIPLMTLQRYPTQIVPVETSDKSLNDMPEAPYTKHSLGTSHGNSKYEYVYR